MANRFLNNYTQGDKEPGSLIGSVGITWGIFFLLGGLPMLAILGWYVSRGQITFGDFLDNPNNLVAMGLPALAVFLGAMGQFPMGFMGIWMGTKWLLKRPLRSLITTADRFRWGRLLMGMVIWMALMGGYGLLIWAKDPTALKFSPDWEAFLLFLPFALILVPVQCAFEEIAIRGQLMQNIHSYLKGRYAPIVPLLISSVFFAVLHSLNPEIATYGYLTMMAQYFTIGLLFGIFTLLDEGLEIAIGIHIGNNLFSFLFISYPGSVLQTPSIFQQTRVEPWQDLLALLGLGTIFFILFYGRQPGKIKSLFVSLKAE